MSRREESIPYMLVHDCPWWVSFILAGAVYSAMRWLAPTIWQDNLVLGGIMKAMPTVAPIAALIVLCLTWLNILATVLKKRARKSPPGSLQGLNKK